MAPKFGTSGLRGLVTDLTGTLCGRYTRAFLTACDQKGTLLIGRDLRPSSPGMARAVARGAESLGLGVIDCGALPTPSLALAAISQGLPSVMVTGSHIPADRNGLKFYTASGEITKDDEAPILAAVAADAWHDDGRSCTLGDGTAAGPAFVRRYLDFFAPGLLGGWRVGVYQHSSVARDMLADLLSGLGAEVVALGRSEVFVPVDTEAIDPETRRMLAGWARDHRLDAIVSTDGDADRPMLADETGTVIAGDVLGALTARLIGADTVVTPVSSTTMIEALGQFRDIRRTRIGSPYVIAGIDAALAETPSARPVGFEPNGGFLLGFDADQGEGRRLPRLMTRDCILPLIAPLTEAVATGRRLSQLVAALPARRTASDRLGDVATDRSLALVARLSGDAAARQRFFDGFGREMSLDLTDGLRVSFAGGLILHLRPSGNAPELRGYAEAASTASAETALRDLLTRAAAALA